MRTQLKVILWMAIAIYIAILTGCGDSSESSDATSSGAETVSEIKIGSLHPMSGSSALEGQQMNNAVLLAVDEVNAAGGIQSLGGATVSVVVGDHEMKAERGVAEVQRMAREGVLGILGAYSSGVTLTATQEAERSQIPFVVTISAVDDVTNRGFDYTFRLQPPASMMASDFLTYIQMLNEELDTPLRTVVIAHENSVFGTSIAEYLSQHAAEADLEILEVIPHSAGAADLTTDVNKIASLNPDIVVPITYLGDGRLLFQTMQSAGFQPKVIIGVANGAISNADFIANDTDLNQYLLDVNYTIAPFSDRAAEVQAAYLEKYGSAMGPNAAYAYEAARVLLSAIERAGTTDTMKIRDEIAKTNYSDHILPQKEIVFGEDGQNSNAQAVMSQIVDGKSIVVFPEQYQQAEIVLP